MSDFNPLYAIERLFALYEQQMFRIAYAVLKDEGQAEDAVMTAFERVVRRQGVPCGPDSAHAKNLMTTMVRQCAIDIYRKNARERKRFVHVVGDTGNYAGESDGPENQAIAACAATFSERPAVSCASLGGIHDAAFDVPTFEDGPDAMATEMLSSLPAPYRDVLHDRFVEERSTRETAEHLGISEANVRKRQQRGLDLLRRQKNGGDYHEPLYCS